MTAPRSDPDRALFADEVKAMRKQREWSRDELGDKIGYSGSTIGNIESMHRAATKDQAERLDEAFGTPGTFQRLEKRLRGVPFSSGFRPFEPYEAGAHTLRSFEHTLVPGLFQTEAYARAVTEAYPEASADDVDERVAGRMARQAILDREDPPPPRIWAVLDQNVLTRNVGGPAVMHRQMAHLGQLARRPRINIQVIPNGRPHPGLLGAFVLAEMGDPPAIVYLENVSNGQTVEDHEMAEAMAVMFDALRMEALTGGASLNLIEEAAERWKEQSETLPPGASPATVAATAVTA
jgi:transcriptional regulator with XRE-family HTH domain